MSRYIIPLIMCSSFQDKESNFSVQQEGSSDADYMFLCLTSCSCTPVVPGRASQGPQDITDLPRQTRSTHKGTHLATTVTSLAISAPAVESGKEGCISDVGATQRSLWILWVPSSPALLTYLQIWGPGGRRTPEPYGWHTFPPFFWVQWERNVY